MAANIYVAIETFVTSDELGADTTVPVGARVEEGDHYHRAKPDAFIPEKQGQLFGRINPANGQPESTKVAPNPPAPVETPENPVVVVPEPKAAEPAPEKTTGPKSSVGRRTLPTKK